MMIRIHKRISFYKSLKTFYFTIYVHFASTLIVALSNYVCRTSVCGGIQYRQSCVYFVYFMYLPRRHIIKHSSIYMLRYRVVMKVHVLSLWKISQNNLVIFEYILILCYQDVTCVRNSQIIKCYYTCFLILFPIYFSVYNIQNTV